MNYRNLPNTDLALSEISFGCMSLEEGNSGNEQLLLKAHDQGINYFDTADLYQKGENEITVGKALKAKRHDVIIATKVGNEMRPDGNGWDWNPSKEYILKAVEKSLKRLQTDYIDIYQLHGGTFEDPVEETIEAFELLKERGLIRHYGISSIRPNVIRRWVEKPNMVGTMMQYSLLDRRPEESCLEYLGDNNVGVIVRGALAKGLLAGKHLGHHENDIIYLMDQMSKMPNRTLNEIAVNYVLASENSTTVTLGIRTIQQLHDAIVVAESNKLSAKEIDVLKGLIKAFEYEAHR